MNYYYYYYYYYLLQDEVPCNTKGKVLNDVYTYFQVHRVGVPTDVDKMKTVRRSMAYFLLPNNDAVINEPVVYKDESLNETAEEKEKRGGILTAKEFAEDCFRKVNAYA